MIHQGEKLEKFIRSKKINITKLAEDLGTSKQSVYNWFEFTIIPHERLEKIKQVLGLEDDFFDMAHSSNVMNEPSMKYGISETVHVDVALDGTEECLDRQCRKLKALNEALKSLNQ